MYKISECSTRVSKYNPMVLPAVLAMPHQSHCVSSSILQLIRFGKQWFG